MTRAEIYTMLKGANIPVAYHQFTEPLKAPPFMCFLYPEVKYTYADNTNYFGFTTLQVELYTDERNFTLESTIEAIFTNNNLTFSKSCEYIEDEKMSMVIYTMEVNING